MSYNKKLTLAGLQHMLQYYHTKLMGTKGQAGGIAELDANGLIPTSQLPSYVDDVLEYATMSAFPVTGQSGKIYVDLSTNLTYRWSGSAYVEISPSLALGTTSSTAFRGDYGQIAYNHSQQTSGNPHNVTKADVGLGNVPNVTTDNQTPTVSEASTRTNLAVGDTLAVIISKIKKFFSDLKTVAFTGDYNDLSNKPTIPTVNNGTLTIQKNGTTIKTFTANQSTNVTANITVPNYTLTQDSTDGHILNFSDGTTTSVITIPDNNTTYHGGTGISVSGNTITNTGVTSLSLSTGSTNGTIAYNISGLQGEVTVKGLGSAAYTASTDYATASHTHSYLPLSGGTLTGRLEIPSGFDGKGIHINASSGDGLYLWGDSEGGNIRIYSPASITTPRYYEIDAVEGNIRVYTTPVDTWQMKVPLQIKPDGIQVTKINDIKINSGTTNVFNGIPIIQGDGIMQIGNEIRFHYSDELPSVNPIAKLTVNSSGTLTTSGAIASGDSILINNGKLLYTDVANSSAYALKFTYFTNPMLQIIPNSDNTVYLGHSSYRFAEVRAVNMYISSGTAVTSDRRKKNNINDIDMDFAENLIMGLKPSSFKYNDGESGRLHYGFIAQDVENLITNIGVSTQNFAPLIIDELKEEIIDKSVDGTERHKIVKTGEVEYSLRYEEFIAPIVSIIQKQQEKINDLQTRLEILES